MAGAMRRGRGRGKEKRGRCYLLPITASKYDTFTLSSSQDPLEAFTCTYKRMDPHSMWKLSNGTIVERRIYEGVTASPSVEGLLAHIWIISSKDLWMKKLFTDEEWEEMHSSRIVQEATESTRSCWDLLSRFKDVSLFGVFFSFRIS